MLYKVMILAFIFIQNFSLISSSEGDRSPFYQNCVKSCTTANCTKDGSSFTNKELQDPWSRLLQWSCRDECRYHCMWRTVHAMLDRGYQIPKFHGKWPFKRILGVQEPASALFSILNLVAHVYMFSKIHRDRRFSLMKTPLLWFWYCVFAVCVHAWAWSTIFHTRDTEFTEFMDYASALSMVMALSIAAFVRALHTRKKLTGVMLLLALAYFLEHARYLRAGRIDYEYNMAVNVCCGVAGSTMWLAWAVARLRRTGRRYAWRVLAFTKLSGAALLLELADFPPLLHACDAHALWHLTTAPLPLLFYRFIIDDLDNSQTEKLSEKTDIKLA